MTKQETAKILFILRSTFPAAYKNMTAKDFDNVINVWAVLFNDYAYSAVEAATNACIMATASDFPPSPGMIVEQIANQADNGPDALEAWSLVKKALRNGINGSEEEYAKLPPLVQKALGSHTILCEWAKLEDETSKNVAQSQFISQYKAVCIREKADSKISENVKRVIRENLPEGMTPRIEAPKAEPLPAAEPYPELPMNEPEYELPFIEAEETPFTPKGKPMDIEDFLAHRGVAHLRDILEAAGA